jgi:hypothetical protein
MENKYYTPDISELYVDYECFWIKDLIKDFSADNLIPVTFTSKKLSSTLFTPSPFNPKSEMDFKPNLMSIRSKYLDSEDIISLGFKEKRKIIDSTNYFNEELKLFLFHNPNNNTIILDNDGDYDAYDCYFQGLCKSKNELKKILEWIK